jgi:hypothetical protein
VTILTVNTVIQYSLGMKEEQEPLLSRPFLGSINGQATQVRVHNKRKCCGWCLRIDISTLTCRNLVYRLLNPGIDLPTTETLDEKTQQAMWTFSRAIEIVILIVVVANVVLIVMDAYDEDSLSPFLLCSTAIFTVEYSLRLWSCVEEDIMFGSGAMVQIYSPSFGRKRGSTRQTLQADTTASCSVHCRSRLWWCLSPPNLLDLACLIPFYVDSIMDAIYIEDTGHRHTRAGAALRSLRLLRLMSLFRYVPLNKMPQSLTVQINSNSIDVLCFG